MMQRNVLGRSLIASSAWASIVVPIGVDGFLFAKAHMNNPAWLPHAKLHCAMSFFAAIFLGLASLALLKARPVSDTTCMGIATFLGTSFWVGLIAAGQWPGTAYDFKNDPTVYMAPPIVVGVPMNVNVVTAVVTVIAGWLGFYLILRQQHSVKSGTDESTNDG